MDGAYGYEGVIRVVVFGSNTSVTAGGQTAVAVRATEVLLPAKLRRYATSTDRDSASARAAAACHAGA
ncbi:hypothetical protein [Streptomyces alanosinicus]|uniref:Uncharacterized protein n=1 Tax=Streptomyces alanosinicus TaxID=68171 RepID=A0A919D626_9ACTN|nr:hypothetical protein [Streptomyces alanosinicus]GHE13359.1 hypothetical protein GCM10010339_80060 [Streptomyces alanosinicus]